MPILNSAKVRHLFWRAGFGLSPNQWIQLKDQTPAQIVPRLFLEAEKKKNANIGLAGTQESYVKNKGQMKARMSNEESKEIRQTNRRNLEGLKSSWLNRMASEEESPLLERMSFFWHGHFANSTKDALMAEQQLTTIRLHALGNFRVLVKAISKDPCMVDYLDLPRNRKKSPNENFARELLELFTIGIGNYTETDIKEATRAFTGYNFDENGRFSIDQAQVDTSQKTFMGKTGSFSGENIIDIILDNPKTAEFIATKVYSHFVAEMPNKTHIRALADVFFKSNYDIAAMMRHLFLADWFYSEPVMGKKIKSPVELMVGLMKTFEISFPNDAPMLFTQRYLGQELYHPPSVKGWDGHKIWINNSSLDFRLNFLQYLTGKDIIKVLPKIQQEAENFDKGKNPFIGTTLTAQKLGKVFQKSLLKDWSELSDYMINLVEPYDLKPKSREENVLNAAVTLASTMEYQLC